MNKGLIDKLKLGATITLLGISLASAGCTGVRQYGVSGYVARECLFGYEAEYQNPQQERDSRSK